MDPVTCKSSSSATKGLIALAVLFCLFCCLVVVIMAYIIHKVKNKDLVMQVWGNSETLISIP